MTSDEILENLKAVISESDYKLYKDEIDKSFRLWDLSKFAEFTPSKEILMTNLDDTVKLAEKMAEEEDVTP
jgi:hypothetical protein